MGVLRHRSVAPRIGVEQAEYFPALERKGTAQHQPRDPVRVRLGIAQGHHGAPRTGQQGPAFNAEVAAQGFQVGHQLVSVVARQPGSRARLAGAALVRQHRALAAELQRREQARMAGSTRPAMQHQPAFAIPRAAVAVGHARPAPGGDKVRRMPALAGCGSQGRAGRGGVLVWH